MSYQTPENLKYTKEHEWALIDGDTVTIGITDFAQQALGDIVFVELPEVGTVLNANDSFGVIESIKSVSDLYAPVSGEVLEKNSDLEANPENINSNPYESWLLKIKITNKSDCDALLNTNDYIEHCQNA